MRARICVLLALGVVCSVDTHAVNAQIQGNERWNKEHDLVNRYEGVDFDREVATAGLELVSFFAVPPNPASAPRLSIDVTHHKTLSVDFLAWEKATYTVAARDLQVRKNYRMEPKEAGVTTPGLNTFQGVWKTDVLSTLRNELPVTNVGVIVSLGPKRNTLQRIAPAILRADTAPRLTTVGSYDARFVADVLLNDLEYEVKEGCDPASATRPLYETVAIGRRYAKTPFVVDFALPDTYVGLAMLEVSYVVGRPTQPPPASAPASPQPGAKNSDDKEFLRYCFWHSAALTTSQP